MASYEWYRLYGGLPSQPPVPTVDDAGETIVVDNQGKYVLGPAASGSPSGTAGGDLAGTYPNPQVTKINGAALSGLATGLLKNTTTTGVPSIAVAADIPNIAESQVTGLVTDLAAKAPLASPALTGTPTAPTATASDNSTKLATTAYVDTASGLLIRKSLVTTKGDIIAASGSAVPVRVPVGADGTVLTADAASTGGVKFAAAGSSGLTVLPSGYGVPPTGFLYQTAPRSRLVNSTPSMTSGWLYMSAIMLPAGLAITKFASAFTGTPTLTHWWWGLYDQNLVQLALTADQLTTNSDGLKSLNIATTAAGAASTFTTTYSGVYYFGAMFVGSVMPTPFASTVALYNTPDSPAIYAPYIAGASDSGQTTPPAFPHTAAAITAGNRLSYALYAAVG